MPPDMKILHKLLKSLGIAAVTVGMSLSFALPAMAQTGFGQGSASLWKLVSSVLLPINTAWSIGGASNRIAAIYTSLLDATSVVIGGAVTGNMVVNGLVTAYNGFTGPTVVATSTSADSTFNRLSVGNATATGLVWSNATGTNTTSTNLSVTRLQSELTPAANNSFDLGSAAKSWSNVFASGTASTLYGINFTNATGTSATTTNFYSTNLFAGMVSSTTSFTDATSTAMRFLATSFGSATQPSLSFAGDSDTGFYRFDANRMMMSGNGTNIFLFGSGASYSYGNLLGGSNNTYDIGAINTNAWRNFYTSSTAYLAGVSSTGAVSPSRNNLYDLGSPNLSWSNIYASGTAALADISWTNATGVNLSVTRVQSDLIPAANNSFDLGSTTLSWNDVYASGTIYGVNETLTGTSTAGPYLFTQDSGAVTAMDMEVTSALAGGVQTSYEFSLDGNSYLSIYARADGSGGLQTTSTAIQWWQDLLPAPHATRNLGAMGTNAINFLYASGTAFLAGVSSTGAIMPSRHNVYDLGSQSLSFGNLFVSSTGYLAHLQVADAGSTTSTLFIGTLSGLKGQLCLGDQDGVGFSCVTANDGVAVWYSTSTY